MEDNTLDFNFWPSFSDLMLTLVLILVIVVFAVIVSFSVKPEPQEPDPPDPEGDVIPPEVKEKQMTMIHAIAEQYGVEPKPKETEADTYVIALENVGAAKIEIKNEATLQRYSFSDRILFRPDRYALNVEGKKTLLIVGHQIKKNLKNFSEIQIQGHADPDTPGFERSNLHLAALRAIEVFRFLQHEIKIDPARHLMSATSFGEYKPVQRSDKDRTYTPKKLKEHNKTKQLKSKNRRIEILLIYPSEQTNPTEG